MKTLYIVVPCYNEEEVLPLTADLLLKKLNFLINNKKITKKSKIVFVDDGSKDNTWFVISNLIQSNKYFGGIKLSGNRGHQTAVMAGMIELKDEADMIISIDADLQDDINVIDDMIDKHYQGAEIVYGVRKSRKKDSFFKRETALTYYKLLKKMGVNIIIDHADYRLVSQKVLNELNKYNETDLFLRGLIVSMGFKHDIVKYDRSTRLAGKSKYSLKKMLALSSSGIVSLSIKPLRLIFSLGLILTLLSCAYLLLLLILLIKTHVDFSLFLFGITFFIGSLNILALGVVGEYVGKTHFETKKRPRWHIEDRINL